MRKRAFLLALALAPLGAGAQGGATEAEQKAVGSIVECLAAGLPEDWNVATMEINLDKPLAETGGVRYRVARGKSEDPEEPFTPCDFKQPAKTLLEARSSQPPARRGWIGARLTLHRDGRFGIRYGYPK